MHGLPLHPDQASTIARGVDHLYYFLTAVDLFFTALIFLTIFYFAIKYRRREEDERPPRIAEFLPVEDRSGRIRVSWPELGVRGDAAGLLLCRGAQSCMAWA